MDEAELKQQLNALRNEYTDSIPVRIDEINNCLNELAANAGEPALLDTLHRLCHTLKGSAATFGFHDLSHQAGVMEQQVRLLQSGGVHDTDWELQLLSNECQQLQLCCQDTLPASTPAQQPLQHLTAARQRNSRHLIYLAEDDLHQSAELELILNHAGYQVAAFNSTSALLLALDQRPPSALILDLCLPEGPFAGPDLAASLQPMGFDDIPVIFISARNDWKARYQAMQAGGSGYLCKPLQAVDLTEMLEHLLHTDDQEPYRILIVEDDLLLAQHYQLVLNYAGMNAVLETQPDKVLSSAARHQPELILMDLHMGEYNGIDVARVIRQHQRLFSIPIVFLSSEKDTELQRQAALNGDHFIEKPVTDDYLLELVLSRSRRSRSLSRLMYHDSLTGLLSQISLRYRLESELTYRKRQQQSLCYIILDLDEFKRINDQHGHGCGDVILKSLARLLQNRMRKSDHVGRISGKQFGVILPDASLQQAHHIIDALRLQFRQQIHHADDQSFHCSFSAGIACSTQHAGAAALMDAADTALLCAKQNGRNRVETEAVTP